MNTMGRSHLEHRQVPPETHELTVTKGSPSALRTTSLRQDSATAFPVPHRRKISLLATFIQPYDENADD
jgi:hypothetical protein